MSIFPSAQNTVITGGNFTAQSFQIHNINESWEKEKYAIQTLEQHVAFGALYNSKERYDPPKCLPRTREAVFREITEWLHVTSNEKPILWLYGPAGAGKSAIAQSVAEKASELGCLLLGTYFFNRSDVQRNNAARLIPSLMYQMMHAIPCTRQYVIATMALGSGVFSLDFRTQIEKLIIQPLVSANVMHRKSQSPTAAFRPILIVVDGLDECQNPGERAVLFQALTESFRSSLFPLVRILCHSRPESDIRAAFNSSGISQLTSRLVLDNGFNPDSDIRTFLDYHFAEIKRAHLLKGQIPYDWPSESVIEELVRRSSGQFIYASTVVKHVASRRHNPMRRLETILTIGSTIDASPFRELDALYRFVLSCFEEEDLSIIIRIIGMICFPPKPSQVSFFSSSFQTARYCPTTPAIIDTTLDLEAGETILLLDDLHSLIDVRGLTDSLCPFHASFGDFLRDRSRSGIYYVDPGLPLADHMLAYFKILLNGSNLPRKADLRVHLPMADRMAEASLTEELLEFFETFPWELVLAKNIPRGALYVGFWNVSGSGVVPWLWRICELYTFCRISSARSPDWVAVYQRTLRGLTACVDYEMKIPKPSELRSAPEEIRCRILKHYIIRILGLSDSRLDPNLVLLDMVLDVIKTPGLSIHHINRSRHNSAIFKTILEALVLYSFPHTTYQVECSILQSSGLRKCCGRSRLDIKGLIELSDRTPHLDSLIPYLETEVCHPDWAPVEEDHYNGINELRAAISRYKRKPIPDDYDYTFQWDGDITALQAAVAAWLANCNNSLLVQLSDVLPFRLTIFE